jgi:hypothetical protein
MSKRDWSEIDSALSELEDLIALSQVPGDHPDELEEVHQLTSVLLHADIARDKCFALRTAARSFYADHVHRHWPLPEVNAAHWRMVGYVHSMRMQVDMLKAADGSRR